MRLSAAPEPLNAAEATSRELVLIDPAVASPEILLEGLRPGLEARLLCADEPAPAQIARAVAGRSLEAVHVIAHGQPGAVAFSGGLLNGQSLAQHQLELEAIGAALGATGQVLLWCCRTAASAAGTAFVEALAQITGVPVAASRSLVGAAARGGSWQLEGGDGSGAAAPLLPAAMASYPGVLITYSQQTGTANPFDGFDVGYVSSPSFADIDADGDLDLVVGDNFGTLYYYRNTGTATAPAYTLQSGTDNPFNGIDVGFSSAPSLADIDGDGDLDLVVGDLFGTLQYYKNTGTATAPVYTLQSGTDNPFNGIDVGSWSKPSFADIDGDGDLDLVLGDKYGSLKYYKNIGSATAPAYTLQSGTANPFDGINFGYYSSPSFADIDGDGDLDLAVGDQQGTLNYYRNTGSATAPAYSLQSGTANPFNGFDVGDYSTPSFADIDGDGDLDLVMGGGYGTLNSFQATSAVAEPIYSEQSGTANPFNGFDVGSFSSPSFADIDGDGDLDLAVGDGDGRLNYVLNVVCFLAGTLIATPTGERPIETLQPGDLITTASGPQPVKFISRTTHFAAILDREDLLPIRISRGAFGQLGPVRDLYVSPDHAILLEGHLLQASVLVNGTTITRTSLQHWRHQRDPIEYLNIELEQHQLITAEGLTVESFVDNLPRSDWDNYAAYLSLYGRELPIRELSLPRIKFSRQIPSALRRSLQQLEASVLTRDQPLAASR